MSEIKHLAQSVRSRANSEDEMGKDAGGAPRGKKWPSHGELVTHPHNSPPNLSGPELFLLSDISTVDPSVWDVVYGEFYGPSLVSLLPWEIQASVFFGTSGVPGDGCAASELGAAREVDWRLFCATGEELG